MASFSIMDLSSEEQKAYFSMSREGRDKVIASVKLRKMVDAGLVLPEDKSAAVRFLYRITVGPTMGLIKGRYIAPIAIQLAIGGLIYKQWGK